MTTTNNTNFSVEAIVAKYRNFVAAHTPKVVQYLEGVGVEEFAADIEDSSSDGQLLITLYNDVAGNNADSRIQRILSKYTDHFYKEALEPEEYAFLQNHFKEMVVYIFANKEGGNPFNIFPYQSLENDESISKFVDSCNNTLGGNVFLYGPLEKVSDIAVRLSNCNVFYGIDDYDLRAWAFVLIRFYAFGIKCEHIRFGHNHDVINTVAFDNVIVYNSTFSLSWHLLIHNPDSYVQKYWDTFCNPEKRLYSQLKENGKLFINTSMTSLYGEGYKSFKEQLIKDKSLTSITMHTEKNRLGKSVSSFDLIIDKSGTDFAVMTNAKGHSCAIKHDDMDLYILLPSYYLTYKPTAGVPLSDLIEFAWPLSMPIDKEEMKKFYKTKRREQGIISRALFENEEIPKEITDEIMRVKVVSSSDLSESLRNADLSSKSLQDRSYYWNLVKELMRKDYVKMPKHWEYKGPIVFLKAIDNELKVGYLPENTEEVFDTIDDSSLLCLSPKQGVDVQYIASRLLSQEVGSVLLSICDGNINAGLLKCLFSKIYVPEKTELDRYKYTAKANYEAMQQALEEQKQMHSHYVKALRMRKHALSQSFSATKAMFSALNSFRERQNGVITDSESISRIKRKTVKEAFEFIGSNLNEMGYSLEHIADIEYSFGEKTWIDPEDFIDGYILKNSKGWLIFKAITNWEKSNIKLGEGKSKVFFYFPSKALERIFDNIIANATSHGFTDKRSNDYKIKFSWRIKADSLIIEIANNGNPIMESMDTNSLLEYGVSSSLHQDGHNGIGCHEIDAIMREYDGKVNIISCPDDEYTVKYELIFNQINIYEHKQVN